MSKPKKNLPSTIDDQIVRKPRMKGLTYLSLEHQRTQDDISKNNLFNHIISNWAIQGCRWNNEPTNIYDLASIIGIPPTIVMEKLSQVGTNIGGLIEPEKIEETLKTIISLSTSWAIQDRGQILKQSEILLEAQGGKYKPFISSEVNKALSLNLASNKNMMDLYKTFFTSNSNTTNILNVMGTIGDQEQEREYVSPDDALLMIHDNQPKELPLHQSNTDKEGSSVPVNPSGLSQEHLESLYSEHGVADMPDCREHRTGTDSLRAIELSEEEKKALKAVEPQSLESSHTNASSRRGEPEDVEDTIA